MQWLNDLTSVCNAACDPVRTGQHWRILLEPTMLRPAVRRILAEGYFLEDVTCMDMQEGYVVLYHFDHYERHGRITLKLVVPHDAPELPSIAGIYQGAEWHERECMDFYPVVFRGNPNPSRLLLPDDMQEKPLVKDATKRVSMLDVFSFTDLVHCAADHPVVRAMEEHREAARLAAEQAAEKAAESDAEGAAGEDGEEA
ncbi:NADH-quinone oxidoreductase subunit C [Desulfobaculum xiamenense]|uniref:NADH-quinone oxidoreductase subunit C n=1 Tax=Desulfobaculum xiamenense TaxID=995050 RepID=A0A846QSR5_9BACT|nr:NADH-quinone oxidoreductase subunit C [Desulfobaculum xiamenense]NJB67689.1 NADH-quinone oxidoreductase subunit C [Desulfobaculum xiamenense]